MSDTNQQDDEVFLESERQRKERQSKGLPPAGELNVIINHAEHLMQTGDSEGKRLYEEALQKKRDYLAGRPSSEYRPPTQTETRRK